LSSDFDIIQVDKNTKLITNQFSVCFEIGDESNLFLTCDESNLFCCASTYKIWQISLLNGGIEAICPTVLESMFNYNTDITYGGIKVDEDMNIFITYNDNFTRIVKLNKTNITRQYGEALPSGGNTMGDLINKNACLGMMVLIAISPIEGAVYCLNKEGYVKRISSATKKKEKIIPLTKLEIDYQNMTKYPKYPKLAKIVTISHANYELHSEILSCRAPSLSILLIEFEEEIRTKRRKQEV